MFWYNDTIIGYSSDKQSKSFIIQSLQLKNGVTPLNTVLGDPRVRFGEKDSNTRRITLLPDFLPVPHSLPILPLRPYIFGSPSPRLSWWGKVEVLTQISGDTYPESLIDSCIVDRPRFYVSPDS